MGDFVQGAWNYKRWGQIEILNLLVHWIPGRLRRLRVGNNKISYPTKSPVDKEEDQAVEGSRTRDGRLVGLKSICTQRINELNWISAPLILPLKDLMNCRLESTSMNKTGKRRRPTQCSRQYSATLRTAAARSRSQTIAQLINVCVRIRNKTCPRLKLDIARVRIFRTWV